jgi:2'-5' RNA ligase
MTKQRPGSPRMRVFLALVLPSGFAEQLDVWRLAAYSDSQVFRTPTRSNLHVTVVFLGYQYVRDLERLEELSLQEPPAAFELQASGVKPVPPRRPRLHALELEEPSGALIEWQSQVSARLADAGYYKPEKRPFWPHLTIARAKRGREREAVEFELPRLPPGLRAPFTIERLTLYSSKLHPAGAVYEALESVPLRAR